MVKQLTFDVTNDGVGIPEKNPNLSDETIDKVNEVYEKIKMEILKLLMSKVTLFK